MKKAIIVGASSGIWKELAILLTKNGYKVGITGRRVSLLASIKNTDVKAFELMEMDITAVSTLPQKLQELADKLEGLDLLVISSGTGELNTELDFELEKTTIETNVNGFTCITDWAFNYFLEKKEGHLVAISSIAGLRGSGIAPSYNASKAYQINYLEGLRQKSNKEKSPIIITDIRPGFVDTNMAKGDGKFWVASPEKAAEQIFTAINKRRKIAYITSRWRLIAWLLKVLPRSLYEKL
jgi:short-subunit dehydrogenase